MSRNTDRLAPHTFNASRRRLLRGAALGAATLAAPDGAGATGPGHPHRLLAGRGGPAVLCRDREGLLQGGRPERRSARSRARSKLWKPCWRAAPTAAPTAPARPTWRSARSPLPACSRSSRPTPATPRTCWTSSSSRKTVPSNPSRTSRGKGRFWTRHPECHAGQGSAGARRRNRGDGGRAGDQPARGRVAAGQLDACYTLEPTGTVGRLNGTTRVLEAGVIANTCWAIRWRPGSAARPR